MERIRELRKKIDEIDSDIIEKLCIRMDIAKEIGMIKKDMGLKVKDTAREKALTRRWEELSRHYELPQKRMLDVLDAILSLSREEQERV
ncbi:MAG TPA: chorismate mutase [Candidatus Methanofastidiosa archaeon]|nr:chorismate mutase [Candidatus Methanofastidiosa archaeon]HPR42306.1 chorismate mutase [Candidatus Methanofastidiosa archaeon]